MTRLTIRAHDDAIHVYKEDVLLLIYHLGRIKSYIHPLNTSTGYTVTVDQPWDHVWHRGLYFSWKYINGVNYWGEGLETDGPWGKSRTVDCTVYDADGGVVGWEQELLWEPAAGGVAHLHEERTIRVHWDEKVPEWYALDWEATFRAREHVVLDRTPNDSAAPWGGYAGLSFRPARAMHADGARCTNSEGTDGAAQLRGQPARWAGFFGHLDGADRDGSALRGGVAIMDHPDNVRHPSPFYAWDDPVMGFLQAAPLFHQPLHLAKNQSLRLVYRVIVTSDVPERAHIERTYDDWIS